MIYFTHDLHFLRERRRFALTGDARDLNESRRLLSLESEIFSRAHRVITPSSDEVAEIRTLVPKANVAAVPLYSVPAAPQVRITAADFAGRTAVLFVGGYAHPPNIDAALFLAHEIMPLVWQEAPDTRLILAGSKPTAQLLAMADARIEVPGWVPELAPLYGRARVAIAPLRFGAGVKGKIVASLQAGVPVVTTSIGNEGLQLRDRVEALLADTPHDLAAATLSLLNDPVLSASLAQAGSDMLQRRFGEDLMRRTVLQVLERDICPVCGNRCVAVQPIQECQACHASPTERALAEAAIRPWRWLRINSLEEAAASGLAGRIAAPAGPLQHAAGGFIAAVRDEADVLITTDTVGDLHLRSGGRWIFPVTAGAEAVIATLMEGGCSVRLHHAGILTAEVTGPGTVVKGT